MSEKYIPFLYRNICSKIVDEHKKSVGRVSGNNLFTPEQNVRDNAQDSPCRVCCLRQSQTTDIKFKK